MKNEKSYGFPLAMLALVLITGGISVFASDAEGVWILTVIAAAAGIGNAVRNRLKFGVWFTERAQ